MAKWAKPDGLAQARSEKALHEGHSASAGTGMVIVPCLGRNLGPQARHEHSTTFGPARCGTMFFNHSILSR